MPLVQKILKRRKGRFRSGDCLESWSSLCQLALWSWCRAQPSRISYGARGVCTPHAQWGCKCWSGDCICRHSRSGCSHAPGVWSSSVLWGCIQRLSSSCSSSSRMPPTWPQPHPTAQSPQQPQAGPFSSDEAGSHTAQATKETEVCQSTLSTGAADGQRHQLYAPTCNQSMEAMCRASTAEGGHAASGACCDNERHSSGACLRKNWNGARLESQADDRTGCGEECHSSATNDQSCKTQWFRFTDADAFTEFGPPCSDAGAFEDEGGIETEGMLKAKGFKEDEILDTWLAYCKR